MYKNGIIICNHAVIAVKPQLKLFRAKNFVQNFSSYKNTHYFTSLRLLLVKPRSNSYEPKLNIYRCIRTSKPNFVPTWVLVNPILKLTALLTGRTFRIWWGNLPPNKKKYFIDRIKAHKKSIGFLLSAIISFSFGYYVTHLEETPITKRRRFMAFNSHQLEKMNAYEFELIMQQLGKDILPADDPNTKHIKALVQRIVDANSDIKELKNKKFGVAVIDSSLSNAFALPIGHVFVFTGMLKLCSNDDQLGNLLAHEIAHCVLNHGAENASFTHILNLISIVVITIIWAFLPSDSISLLTQWLYSKSKQVVIELPFSRKLEVEADELGLKLAAKACFDVRESSAFWDKMAFFDKSSGFPSHVEFLSTHPSHENRSEHFNNIMDEAIKLRSECGCPELPPNDPRRGVETITKTLELTRKKQAAKPVIVIK